MKDADALRSWLRILIERNIVVSTNDRSKSKEYRVNPDILRGSQYKGKTSLKRIENYRIKELILEDLKIYKVASANEIQKRIGEEIPSKKVWEQLQILIETGVVKK